MPYLFREIRRLKWRSILITLLISFSIAFVSIVDNLATSEMNTMKNIYGRYSVADITIYLNETYPSDILDSVGLEKQEWYGNSEYILSVLGNSYLNDERVISILWGIKSPTELNKINATNETWKKFTGNVGLIDRRLGDALGISSGDNVSIFLSDKVINITILDLVDMAWSISFTRPIMLYIATPLDFVMDVLSLDSEKYNTILLDVEYGYDVDEVANKAVELLEDKNIFVSTYTALNVEALEQYVERFSVIFTLLMAPISIIAAMFIIIIFLQKIPQKPLDYIWGMNAVWEGGRGAGWWERKI